MDQKDQTDQKTSKKIQMDQEGSYHLYCTQIYRNCSVSSNVRLDE